MLTIKNFKISRISRSRRRRRKKIKRSLFLPKRQQ
jgi:hypothetical protein